MSNNRLYGSFDHSLFSGADASVQVVSKIRNHKNYWNREGGKECPWKVLWKYFGNQPTSTLMTNPPKALDEIVILASEALD